MASEASKIRNQCAKKYGLREKAYKQRIDELSAEVASQAAMLKDYEDMKRAYIKMALYCGLSKEEKERLLNSKELDEVIGRFGRLLQLDAEQLQHLGSSTRGKDTSLADLVAGVEKLFGV